MRRRPGFLVRGPTPDFRAGAGACIEAGVRLNLKPPLDLPYRSIPAKFAGAAQSFRPLTLRARRRATSPSAWRHAGCPPRLRRPFRRAARPHGQARATGGRHPRHRAVRHEHGQRNATLRGMGNARGKQRRSRARTSGRHPVARVGRRSWPARGSTLRRAKARRSALRRLGIANAVVRAPGGLYRATRLPSPTDVSHPPFEQTDATWNDSGPTCRRNRRFVRRRALAKQNA